jgi:dimethylargininase
MVDEIEDEEFIELEDLSYAPEFEHAIVRMPSPALAQGIAHNDLGKPDYAHFLQQHLSYTAVLRSLGMEIIKLPSLHDFPDSQFVEDVAVVLPEIAILARPGVEERRGEVDFIREALAEYRPLAAIEEPGTLEGGDVFRVDERIFVGLSKRTNKEGAEQLAAIVEPLGYSVYTMPVKAGLHLRSEVNYIGRNTLLMTETWAKRRVFSRYDKIIVSPDEAHAANSLLVNERVLMAEGFPETVAALRDAGFEVLQLVMSEVQKLDGGLTCLSLRF